MPMPTFDPRLGCSTISFRHQDLATALATIAGLGFAEIDLGALPGVCDHVPYVLDAASVAKVAAQVADSGLRVRSINGDIGDLNAALDSRARVRRDSHLDLLLALAESTGARALVLPCGALDRSPIDSLGADLDRVAAELVAAAYRAAGHGVELWTESLHYHRLCCDIGRAQQLTDRITGWVGLVMDFSHIVASGGDPVEFVDRFGPQIVHVHLRDAVAGNINLSVGNGRVDFAGGFTALADAGYCGHFSLELETRDITDEERPARAARTAHLITDLI